jgi:hypothetical protein
MASLRSPFVVSALLAASLSAQSTLVVPNNRTTTEGNSLSHMPLGFSQVRHCHYIARPELTAIPVNASISELRYRRDGVVPGNLTRNASTAWGVRMANITSPINPVTPGANFLLPAQLTTVFIPKAISWPTLPAVVGGGPAPFLVTFPFDQPLIYTGNHLAIDHYNFETAFTIQNYLVDYEQATFAGGTVSTFGVGCPAGFNRASGTAPNPGGGNLNLFLHDAPPGTVSIGILGSSSTAWGAIPLPLPLTGAGLTGCTLYTDLALLLPLVVQTSGLGQLSLAVPGDPSLLSAHVFTQFLNINDDRVNPAMRLATSEALDITLGAALGIPVPLMSVVYGQNALANARGGSVFSGEGPVVQLVYN